MASNGDIMRLCRLCLVKDEVNIPIFDDHSSVQQIFMKISSCLPVTISKEDKLPKKICDGCSGKLDMLYQFWNTSAKAEKQLLLWLNQAGINFEKTKMDTNSSASEQSINKAVDSSIVKQENEDYVEGKVETSEISTDAKSYILQQQQLPYQKEFSFPEKDPVKSGVSAKSSETEEPPPKRARRAAAMKAPIQSIDSDDEDDEIDDIEPITKTEDESEDSGREEDNDPSFEPASASADDQPGPSGVGKGSADASCEVFFDDTGTEDANYKCGVCSLIFESKEDFLGHHISQFGQMFSCCKCGESFKTCSELYQHYDTHKIENLSESEEIEEVVLDYDEEGTEQIVTINREDSSELLYILDDSQCVNEVVIEGDEAEALERIDKTETIRIVNLEHGYMIRNIEDDNRDGAQCIISSKPVFSSKANQASNKRLYTTPKSRTPQPKRRHELPDFSTTDYTFISPNDEIDIAHYKCLRCEQLFINKFVFYRHIEKGKCFINNCDVCTRTFSKNSEFYEHYIAEHTDRAICNFCFRTFMYEKNVKEHMLRHLDQFRHRCEECSKGFYTVREYRNHYKNRHMGIRHKCEVCGRSFADEYYFKRHIATHTKSNKPVTSTVTS